MYEISTYVVFLINACCMVDCGCCCCSFCQFIRFSSKFLSSKPILMDFLHTKIVRLYTYLAFDAVSVFLCCVQ